MLPSLEVVMITLSTLNVTFRDFTPENSFVLANFPLYPAFSLLDIPGMKWVQLHAFKCLVLMRLLGLDQQLVSRDNAHHLLHVIMVRSGAVSGCPKGHTQLGIKCPANLVQGGDVPCCSLEGRFGDV